MRRMAPGLRFAVPNTLQNDGTDLAVELKFESMQDFEPGAIVEQVPALKALLDARNELRDLLSKADRSEDLERMLKTSCKTRAIFPSSSANCRRRKRLSLNLTLFRFRRQRPKSRSRLLKDQDHDRRKSAENRSGDRNPGGASLLTRSSPPPARPSRTGRKTSSAR